MLSFELLKARIIIEYLRAVWGKFAIFANQIQESWPDGFRYVSV